VVWGDGVLLPRHRVAVDVFHLCSHCFGHRSLVWLPPPSVVPSRRRYLWMVVVAGGAAGAEAKAFDWVGLRRKPFFFLEASFVCPFSLRAPNSGRLIGGSSYVPALLHFTYYRLSCLGRGGCFATLSRCLLMFADSGSLALADALPPCLCCLVGALPPGVSSCLADAWLPFLYSGGCFAAMVVLLGG